MSCSSDKSSVDPLDIPMASELSAEQLKQLRRENGESVTNDAFEHFAKRLSMEEDEFISSPAAPPASSCRTPATAAAATAAAAAVVPSSEASSGAVASAAASESAAAASSGAAAAAATAVASPTIARFRAVHRPGVEAARVIRDIPYTANPTRTSEGAVARRLYGDLRQQFDIYLPPAEIITSATPVVLHVHGGGWIRGCRSANNVVKALGSTDFSVYGAPSMCHTFASAGCVAVATGYRVGKIQDILVDVVTSLKHISDKKHLSALDPALDKLSDNFKIVLSGHSAGAQVVMLLATDPTLTSSADVDVTRLAGVVGLSGPYTIRNPFTDEVSNWRNFVFQRTYIRHAFPADLRMQDLYSPTFRVAQQSTESAALDRYWHETREAPGWFESGSTNASCCACADAVNVREPEEVLAEGQKTASKHDEDQQQQQQQQQALAASAKAAAAAQGNATQGYNNTRLPSLPPTLLQQVGLPVIILYGTSDLGLEYDSQRLYSFLQTLSGYDAAKKVRAKQVAGASHASINKDPLSRDILVMLMNEVFFV